MPQFSDAQLSKWANDYERELCAKWDLVADRYSIPVISGLSEYELPNYITNIRMILFKGKEIHPKGFIKSIMTNDIPAQTVGSAPFEYLFSGKGARVIKFYPTPNETVAAYVGDLWTPAADLAAVIVEFYRTPVFTDQFKRLPSFIRRYLIKDYLCMKAFQAEGPQQDLRAAQYYELRLSGNEGYLGKVKQNMHAGIIHVQGDVKMNARRKPGYPVLPSNFGVRCI